MQKFIPLSVPNIKGNELAYVKEALEKEWVSTAGAMIVNFENEISKYVHSVGAVACQSGTAGIHLSLRYFNVCEGDEIIVPTLTFIAAVNPVAYEKANPVFIDCDSSLCMDPNKLEKFLIEKCSYSDGIVTNIATGNRVRGIIIVHVFGNIADMVEIMRIAEDYKLFVIEDATEALGSYFSTGDLANCYAGTIGHVGVYSFNGNKIITTGGGGMIVSNDISILNKVRYLSTQAKDDELNFIHNEIGFNYRMTNIQAAIGLAQLERLDEFIEIKKRNYFLYKELTLNLDSIKLLDFRKDISPNYWFYSFLLKNEKIKKDFLIQEMQKRNIQVRPIWGLISEQQPYRGCISFEIEEAKNFYNLIFNVPCSSNLSSEDVMKVVSTMNAIVGDLR